MGTVPWEGKKEFFPAEEESSQASRLCKLHLKRQVEFGKADTGKGDKDQDQRRTEELPFLPVQSVSCISNTLNVRDHLIK